MVLLFLTELKFSITFTLPGEIFMPFGYFILRGQEKVSKKTLHMEAQGCAKAAGGTVAPAIYGLSRHLYIVLRFAALPFRPPDSTSVYCGRRAQCFALPYGLMVKALQCSDALKRETNIRGIFKAPNKFPVNDAEYRRMLRLGH